ncbi:YadA-like family protein [Acidaminococcus massiliensis]|uniref:YadA-like family protein n=1 Tax=Acidaminococcus massiliensis TaxID=1852375 RepID=UPI00248E09AA|nr:YadA-like family protein [Acidaminococcus massiliensis]
MLTQKKKQSLLLACTGMLLQLPLPQIGWAANPTDEIHYYSNTYALTQDGSNYANDGAAGYYAMAIGGEAKAVGNWSIAIGNLAKATASESIVLGYKTDTGTDGSSKVAIGYQATATGDHGTALGAEAKASGTNSTAIGRTTRAEGDSSTAVGSIAEAKGEKSTALGQGSNALGTKSTALGYGASVKEGTTDAVALGVTAVASANKAVALGTNSTGKGENGVAVGYNALSAQKGAVALGYGSQALGTNSLALGTNATASVDKSVALGYYSKTEPVVRTSSASITTVEGKQLYLSGFAGKSPVGTVSLGWTVNGKSSDRTLTHVAAGRISETSTDAVNGSQLYALGRQIRSGSSISLQAGKGITIQKAGDGYTISASLIGLDTEENRTHVVYGKDLEEHHASEKEAGEAAGSGQTGDRNAYYVEVHGNPLQLQGDEGTAQINNGDTQTITGDGINIHTVVKQNGSDAADVQVKLDPNLKVDSVTIQDGGPVLNGEGLAMEDRKITGLAEGEISQTSKEAVNGSQLYQVKQDVWQNAQNINQLNNRVSNLDSRINKVGAGAAALAALHPQDFDPDDKWDFAAGFGNYRDANAAAIGVFYRPDHKTMVSAGGTFGNGENMVNLGISLKLGKSSPYAGMSRHALIGKVESQAREISDLQQQTQSQNERIAQLEKVVAELLGHK